MTGKSAIYSLKNFPMFDGSTDYRSWPKKARIVVKFASKNMPDVRSTSPTLANAVVLVTRNSPTSRWKKARTQRNASNIEALRKLLHNTVLHIGETTSDQRFQAIVLHGITDDYIYVSDTHHRHSTFGLEGTKIIVENTFVDILSRCDHGNPSITERGAVIQMCE